MCSRRRRPSPPPLPPKEPVDSPIEETAQKVVVGEKRKGQMARRKKGIGTFTGRRRLGTRSLQIPLLSDSTSTSNLNYS